VAIPGIPFDERAGVVPNEAGRAEPGLYVAGWIKRGPSGLIGTNKKDSEETVDQILADVSAMDPTPRPGDERVAELLADRGVRAVSYEDWLKLDQAEIERGKAAGKPREKFTRIEEMIAYLDEQAEVDAPSS
jgi:ferredoxin--NADP+ reductase